MIVVNNGVLATVTDCESCGKEHENCLFQPKMQNGASGPHHVGWWYICEEGGGPVLITEFDAVAPEDPTRRDARAAARAQERGRRG